MKTILKGFVAFLLTVFSLSSVLFASADRLLQVAGLQSNAHAVYQSYVGPELKLQWRNVAAMGLQYRPRECALGLLTMLESYLPTPVIQKLIVNQANAVNQITSAHGIHAFQALLNYYVDTFGRQRVAALLEQTLVPFVVHDYSHGAGWNQIAERTRNAIDYLFPIVKLASLQNQQRLNSSRQRRSQNQEKLQARVLEKIYDAWANSPTGFTNFRAQEVSPILDRYKSLIEDGEGFTTSILDNIDQLLKLKSETHLPFLGWMEARLGDKALAHLANTQFSDLITSSSSNIRQSIASLDECLSPPIVNKLMTHRISNFFGDGPKMIGTICHFIKEKFQDVEFDNSIFLSFSSLNETHLTKLSQNLRWLAGNLPLSSLQNAIKLNLLLLARFEPSEVQKLIGFLGRKFSPPLVQTHFHSNVFSFLRSANLELLEKVLFILDERLPKGNFENYVFDHLALIVKTSPVELESVLTYMQIDKGFARQAVSWSLLNKPRAYLGRDLSAFKNAIEAFESSFFEWSDFLIEENPELDREEVGKVLRREWFEYLKRHLEKIVSQDAYLDVRDLLKQLQYTKKLFILYPHDGRKSQMRKQKFDLSMIPDSEKTTITEFFGSLLTEERVKELESTQPRVIYTAYTEKIAKTLDILRERLDQAELLTLIEVQFLSFVQINPIALMVYLKELNKEFSEQQIKSLLLSRFDLLNAPQLDFDAIEEVVATKDSE